MKKQKFITVILVIIGIIYTAATIIEIVDMFVGG